MSTFSNSHLTRWLFCVSVLFTSLLLPSRALSEPAKLAIIIDDLGNHQRGCKGVLALPGPLNLAFLPHTPYARRFAERAFEQGHTVMLHLPMSNHSGATLGPGALEVTMTTDELRATMEASLDAVPHSQGFNNHMGSLLTEHTKAMQTVMTLAHERQLFFIDSRTSVNSVAREQASQAGVPNLRRHVFLDNDVSGPALEQQFDQAVRRAKRHGLAVLIGHPYPETIAFLNQKLNAMSKHIELVSLATLLQPSVSVTTPYQRHLHSIQPMEPGQ